MSGSRPAAKYTGQMEKVAYRVVEDCITRLQRIYQQHLDEPESGLFCPEAVNLRHKLKSALLKIVFLTPADFGAKGEDLLWRKVFYEPLAWIKRCRQSTGRLNRRVEALYRAHLLSGLGFYQQLLTRVLLEYPVSPGDAAGLDFGCVDFAPAPKLSGAQAGAQASEPDWARSAVHRCLMHMGDLYRYQREFQGEVALALVQRYYGAAARFEPQIGLPYNQLGTLDVGNYYNLTALYYYLRCLACEQPFEGSRRNLAKILMKNQRRFESLPQLSDSAAAADTGRAHKPVKQFAVRFIHLVGQLLQPHDLARQHRRRQGHRQLDAELNALCQSVLASLSACLPGSGDEDADCVSVRASDVDPMRPHRLADSAVLQAALSAVLCLDSLTRGANNSRHAHACTAFCLGLFACVLRCALARCRLALQQTVTAAAPAKVSDGDARDDGDEAGEDGEVDGVESAEQVGDEDEDEEEEVAGDFPGFSAPRRRRRQRRRRRRGSSGGDSAASSMSSSDCSQLVFDYGDEEDDEEAEAASAAEAEPEKNESDGDDEAGAAVAAAAAGTAAGLPSFCFSYGIPSALIDRAEDMAATPEAGAVTDKDAGPAAAQETVDNRSETAEPQANNEDSAAAASEAIELLLSRVRLLRTVKLLLDWMLCQPHLLSRPVQSSCLPLWDALSDLLNLLPAPPGEDCGVICPEPERSPALPEDAHARGLGLFRPAQRHLDFAASRPGQLLDETRLRLAAIRRFGFLAVQNDQLAFEFDPVAGQFLGPTAVAQVNRDAQMRNLAQLRLISQVQQLETAVSQAAPSITFSHAVPSRQCLTDGLAQLKSLVRSRRCILVLPRSSIDHLDRLKGSSQAARQASRFLEAELRSGRGLINAQDFPTLTSCAKRLDPATTVFLVRRGESPPQIELPFSVRELDEFVRQALAPGQAG